MSLFTELKRRNVFKVAAAYLVVGWVMIEVASTVAPHLNLPEWAPRIVTFFVLIGFPLALVLAWIFDMTPEGMQVTEGGTGNKRFYGVVAVIVAVALAWFFIKAPEEAVVPTAETTVAVPAAEARPSIAVLAFEDLSQEGDQAYFARGISEELLNILSGIGGLKVASRTSAFSFAGTSTPLPEIARQLDVAHVLEGSVRKQGNRVRITAQLIDAGTDAHLWSETYDRDLTDIFAVQEEIAQAITTALQVVLGTQQVSVEAPTQDLEAYELFLRGRSRFYQRVELDEATEDLQKAVALDPGFTQAWTYLGAVAYVLSDGGYGTTQDTVMLKSISREAIDRTLAADADIPLALALRAQHLFKYPDAERYATGISLLERAAARMTEDSTPRMWLGIQYLQLGYTERALATLQQVVAQDPLVPINNGYLGLALYYSGREAEGIFHAQRSSELSGGRLDYWLVHLSGDLAARGEVARARTLLRDATPAITDDLPQAGREYAVAMHEAITALGNDTAERRLIRQLRAKNWPIRQLEYFSVAFGELDLLLDGVRADEERFSPELALAAWLPSFTLREHPAYFAHMKRWGLADYWAANGYPSGCRLVTSAEGDHLDCSARRLP